jgi:hypothetical protein
MRPLLQAQLSFTKLQPEHPMSTSDEIILHHPTIAEGVLTSQQVAELKTRFEAKAKANAVTACADVAVLVRDSFKELVIALLDDFQEAAEHPTSEELDVAYDCAAGDGAEHKKYALQPAPHTQPPAIFSSSCRLTGRPRRSVPPPPFPHPPRFIELEDFLSVFHLIKQGHSKNLARSLTKPEERLVLKMLQTRIKSHLSAIEILAVELTEEEMAQLKETFRAAADRNSHPSSAAATTEGGGSDKAKAVVRVSTFQEVARKLSTHLKEMPSDKDLAAAFSLITADNSNKFSEIEFINLYRLVKRGDVKRLSSGSGFFKTKQQTQKEETMFKRRVVAEDVLSPELVSTLRSRFRTESQASNHELKAKSFPHFVSDTLTELGEVDLPRLQDLAAAFKVAERKYSKVSEDEFLHLCRLIKRDGIHGLAGGPPRDVFRNLLKNRRRAVRTYRSILSSNEAHRVRTQEAQRAAAATATSSKKAAETEGTSREREILATAAGDDNRELEIRTFLWGDDTPRDRSGKRDAEKEESSEGLFFFTGMMRRALDDAYCSLARLDASGMGIGVGSPRIEKACTSESYFPKPKKSDWPAGPGEKGPKSPPPSLANSFFSRVEEN